MNEELQAELLKIVTNINTGTESAWGFITQQTPDVVQQLLLWHGVSGGIRMLLGVLLLIVIVYGNYRQIKMVQESSSDFGSILPLNLFQVILIVPLCLLLNFQWLQIWIAPKVWLLEYITTVIK